METKKYFLNTMRLRDMVKYSLVKQIITSEEFKTMGVECLIQSLSPIHVVTFNYNYIGFEMVINLIDKYDGMTDDEIELDIQQNRMN